MCYCVSTLSHVCSVCLCVCVLTFVTSQLQLANLPRYLQSTSFLSLSLSVCLSPLRSHLPLSLSDEQIELLNELFLWAPNAHPQLSICSFPCIRPSLRLPRLIHPPPPPTLFCPALLLQQYLYLQALKYTPVNTFTVTCAIPRCACPVKRYTRGNLRAYF